MYCPQCHLQLDPSQLVCPNCTAHVAKIYQEQRLRAAKDEVENSVRASFLSPLFIIISSVISVLTTLYLINFLSMAFVHVFSFIFGALFYLIPGIFGILTTISCWQIVASRNRRIENVNVENISNFLRILKVYKAVALVFIAIIGTSIFLIVSTDFAYNTNNIEHIVENYGEYIEQLTSVSNYFAFFIIFAVALLMFISINHVVTYGNAKSYIQAMNRGLEGGISGVEMKPPFVRMFIFGTLGVLLTPFILSYELYILGLIEFFNAFLLISFGILFIINNKKANNAVENAKKEKDLLEYVKLQTKNYIYAAADPYTPSYGAQGFGESANNQGVAPPPYQQQSYGQQAYQPIPPQYQQAPGYQGEYYPPQNYEQPTYQQNNYPYQ